MRGEKKGEHYRRLGEIVLGGGEGISLRHRYSFSLPPSFLLRHRRAAKVKKEEEKKEWEGRELGGKEKNRLGVKGEEMETGGRKEYICCCSSAAYHRLPPPTTVLILIFFVLFFFVLLTI